MAELLSVADLPAGFAYPHQFVRVVELGLTRLEPWWIIEGDALRQRLRGLRRRYPARTIVPFAMRQDRDDVACFEPGEQRIVVVHDYADPRTGSAPTAAASRARLAGGPGFELREMFPDFNAWFRAESTTSSNLEDEPHLSYRGEVEFDVGCP